MLRRRTPAREHLRAIYARLLIVSGSAARAQARLQQTGAVLMYHRVLNDDQVPAGIDPGMYVTGSSFERHLRYLRRHHEVVGLDDLLDWIEGRRHYARPPCVITFDDGWADNYDVAYPLLQAYGLSATIFLITDLVGTADMVTWAQVREMHTSGIAFGSHTATHPVLTAVSDEAIADELQRSKDRLEVEFRQPCRWFCYPKGQYDDRSLAAARRVYTGAVSVREGRVSPGDDLHQIRRIGVHNDVTRTTALFVCRLTSLL